MNLAEVKRIIQGLTPEKLSDERFDQAHEEFEKQSSQQSQIRNWLAGFTTEQIRAHVGSSEARSPFRILSVGCGSGILDLPLIQALTETDAPTATIDYIGFDPNPVACERFRRDFRRLNLASTRLDVLQETVESYRPDRVVDVTHVVHALYYFEEPAQALAKLLTNTSRRGHLIIFQAPKGALNLLADCFWQDHLQSPIWFSDDLTRHLNASDFAFTQTRLDAEVDITNCFDTKDPAGHLTFDFLVQSDCTRLPESTRRGVLDHLRSISLIDAGRVLAPHPVDVFVVTRGVAS